MFAFKDKHTPKKAMQEIYSLTPQIKKEFLKIVQVAYKKVGKREGSNRKEKSERERTHRKQKTKWYT